MAKAKAASPPNEAQKAFVIANCQTHSEAALVECTGLDLETATTLRLEALKQCEGRMVQDMSQIHDGVFAMNQGVSERVSDSAKYGNEEQRKAFEARQSTFIHKIR